MTEVTVESQGYLQDLLNAIQELLAELAQNLEKIESDYRRVEDLYFKKKEHLEQVIDEANVDIANYADMINNVLFPMRDNYSNKLSQLKNFIEENRKNLAKETQQRSNSHQNYLDRASEHSNAINAVDECLSLLQGISNGGSLAQITRLSTQIQTISKQVSKKEELGPIIKVIMELASQQNFSDQGVIKQLVQQFNQLRKNIVDSLNQENADEAEQVKVFGDRVQALNAEYTEFLRQVNEGTYQLAAINSKLLNDNHTFHLAKLDNYTVFLKERTNDKNQAEQDLQESADWYASETQIYTDLKQKQRNNHKQLCRYTQETDAASQAYNLVSNPDFVNYIKSKGGF